MMIENRYMYMKWVKCYYVMYRCYIMFRCLMFCFDQIKLVKKKIKINLYFIIVFIMYYIGICKNVVCIFVEQIEFGDVVEGWYL